MTVLFTGASISSTRRCATLRPFVVPLEDVVVYEGHTQRGALGEGGHPSLIPANVPPGVYLPADPIGNLEMQKAPGFPGAFVLLCFYSLSSRETMQLGQLGARR